MRSVIRKARSLYFDDGPQKGLTTHRDKLKLLQVEPPKHPQSETTPSRCTVKWDSKLMWNPKHQNRTSCRLRCRNLLALKLRKPERKRQYM